MSCDNACFLSEGGKITGEIKVDGHPMVASTFARISGYVSPSVKSCSLAMPGLVHSAASLSPVEE